MNYNKIWSSKVLVPGLDPHEAGVPLVQTVIDGKYHLSALPPGGDLADVVAWTTRDMNGDLIAEMEAGDIHGVDGFSEGQGPAIGNPVFFDPDTRRLSKAGAGNFLLGSVVDVDYAFPLHPGPGHHEDGRRVHVASGDSIELNEWAPCVYDAQIIIVNDRPSGHLRVYGASQSDLLAALMPGEAVRWRHDGNQWERSSGPLYTAAVRLARPRRIVTVKPAQLPKRTAQSPKRTKRG